MDIANSSNQAGASIIPSHRHSGRHRCLAATLALAIAGASAASISLPALAAVQGEITKADYFKPELAPVRQAGPYDVTVVYFMDYQCPACRKHTPDVAKVFSEDRRVRVIYRDTPIFGARSEQAARVAIASQFQGKHQAMHAALMAAEMPLDEQALRAAAKRAGVDWDHLQRDLEARSDEIDTQIAWNMELSMATGIAGTPAFIVGDTLADGALDYKGLKAEIADARAENAAAPAAPAPQPIAEAEPESPPDAPPASGKESEVAAAAPEKSAAEKTAVRQAPFEKKPVTAGVDATSEEAGAGFAIWPWLAGAAAAALALFAWVTHRRSA